nr:uncharacterized protein LOC109153488 [Ipomoea trifida]
MGSRPVSAATQNSRHAPVAPNEKKKDEKDEEMGKREKKSTWRLTSIITHSHDSTWRKRDQKKAGDLESRFLTSSYAILLRLAMNNLLPTVAAHYISKKMATLLFKIQNFIDLIYDILCKQGFQKYQDEEEKTIGSKYVIDKRLFQRSHFDDFSFPSFIVVAASEGTSVSATAPSVCANVVAVRLRLNTARFLLANLQTAVAQIEKMVLDDTLLLHSLENEEQIVASTR